MMYGVVKGHTSGLESDQAPFLSLTSGYTGRPAEMRYKDFAKTGRKVSEIGMGTYYDPLWIATGYMGWRRGSATKIEAIKAGL